MPERLVAGLAELGRTDRNLAGGKGANLGELLREGFAVPGGFVVTTRAYEVAAACAGLDRGRIAELLAAGAQGGAAIRAGLEAITVPKEIAAAIRTAYLQLGSGPVAVRSSATAEDLPGAAFAGQQDTYLNVKGEPELLDAVKRCWASLWTDRAISYREKRGIDSHEVRIAVVVQTMVEAESAGVLFTANPLSGKRDELVVDAGVGLGEAVVSGLVTPDHYRLSEQGELIDWWAGRQEVVIRGTAAGGVEYSGQDAGSSEAAGGPDSRRVLTDEQLAELARAATAGARHFGRPQDIEWAFDSERLWLLQARPMTALPPPPLRLNRRQRLLGTVLHEYLPERPYPIDVSTWLTAGPAGMMAKVASTFGVRGAFEDFLVENEGVVERFIPPSPRPSAALLRAPFRMAAKARRYDPRHWTEDARFKAFLERNALLAARELSIMPWPELIRIPRQALELLEPITDLRIDYLPRAAFAMLRLVMVLRLLGESERWSLLLGGASTRTEDANRALEALAQEVRADPELKRAFAELEPKRLLAVVPGFPDFAARLRDFLTEFGHRETTTPVLLTPPTWGESPETVLGLVKVLASGPPLPTSPASSEQALEQLLARPLIERLGLRGRLTRWVETARSGIAFREDSHFYMTLPLPVLRRSVLEIGRRLVNIGVVETPEQVFHLRFEELEAIGDPKQLNEAEKRELGSKVHDRSTRREELAGVPLIDTGSLITSPPTAAGALVAGTPAGGGTASGPVRIIHGPNEFSRLRSGDVLVCPYTNPSWTPLFQRAAAVVVDSGGVASHAAIVAREYGIPAVMATRTGTTVLEDDQLVNVDGGSGLVTSVAAGPGPG